MKKNVFRKGDKVKIINPLMLIRCGYPLTLQQVKDTGFTPDEKTAIRGLIHKCDLYTESASWLRTTEKAKEASFNRVLHALAVDRLRQLGWGGRERQIVAKLNEDFQDKEMVVCEKKIHKTGIYHAGHNSVDYWGEHDYEPAYLENEKTHVILGLTYGTVGGFLASDDARVWIEDVNVERIIK